MDKNQDKLSHASKQAINSWLEKFPATARQSAIIPALTIAQRQNAGILTKQLIVAIAQYLQVAPITVFEVATFYQQYTIEQ